MKNYFRDIAACITLELSDFILFHNYLCFAASARPQATQTPCLEQRRTLLNNGLVPAQFRSGLGSCGTIRIKVLHGILHQNYPRLECLYLSQALEMFCPF